MGLLDVQHVEAGTAEDNGYFFQRLGEVRFTKRSKDTVAAHIAVAATHGVVAYADDTGKQFATAADLACTYDNKRCKVMRPVHCSPQQVSGSFSHLRLWSQLCNQLSNQLSRAMKRGTLSSACIQ